MNGRRKIAPAVRLYAVSCCRRNFFLRRTQKIVYLPMTSMPTAVSCNEERKWIVCRAYHIRKDHARESAGDSEILGISIIFSEWNIFSRLSIQ